MCQLLLIYVMPCYRLEFVACESGMFTYNAIQTYVYFQLQPDLAYVCVLQLFKYLWSFHIKGVV